MSNNYLAHASNISTSIKRLFELKKESFLKSVLIRPIEVEKRFYFECFRHNDIRGRVTREFESFF